MSTPTDTQLVATEKKATPWVIDFRVIGVDDVKVPPQNNPRNSRKHYRTTANDPIQTQKPNSSRTASANAATSQRNAPIRKIGAPVRNMSPKQIRARARRHQRIADAELEALYKPLDEWDAEELARGQPRNKAGNFGGGSKPGYISRAFHEKIIKQFTEVVRMEMREQTVEALVVMKKVMTDETLDSKGRPLVPASTKMQAAMFLLEHVVGKPTQRTETDISIKLQAILGSAMLNPGQAGPNGQVGQPELTQGYIDAEVVEDEGESND